MENYGPIFIHYINQKSFEFDLALDNSLANEPQEMHGNPGSDCVGSTSTDAGMLDHVLYLIQTYNAVSAH